jgi:hypothetical protein
MISSAEERNHKLLGEWTDMFNNNVNVGMKTFSEEGPTTTKTRMQESKEHRGQIEKLNFG